MVQYGKLPLFVNMLYLHTQEPGSVLEKLFHVWGLHNTFILCKLCASRSYSWSHSVLGIGNTRNFPMNSSTVLQESFLYFDTWNCFTVSACYTLGPNLVQSVSACYHVGLQLGVISLSMLQHGPPTWCNQSQHVTTWTPNLVQSVSACYNMGPQLDAVSLSMVQHGPPTWCNQSQHVTLWVPQLCAIRVSMLHFGPQLCAISLSMLHCGSPTWCSQSQHVTTWAPKLVQSVSAFSECFD